MTTHNPPSDCVPHCVPDCVPTVSRSTRETTASRRSSPYGETDAVDELNTLRRPTVSQPVETANADRSSVASRTGVLEVPGVPMFDRPGARFGDQVVRPIFELRDDRPIWFLLMDDRGVAPDHWCALCEVCWSGEGGCWMCGRAA